KLADTGVEAKKLGTKALLLTGRTAMQKTGTLAKVLGLLKSVGVESVPFEAVEPNPRQETLDQAVALGLKEGCDLVIGLGGGSPMDSAKAVAMALAHALRGPASDAPGTSGQAFVSVWEWTSGMGAKRRKVENPLPTLLISSTAATGSEGNCAAVITKWATHEKAVLWDLGAFPSTSIVDPQLMLSLPLESTRDGAVDMMLHVLEQHFNGDDKAVVQDRISEGLCLGVMESLAVLEKDLNDLTARENLSWASVAALLGGGGPNWGRAGGFTVHHLEHPLSGYTDVAHGRGLALLWPHYLRAIAGKREAKIARLGHVLWGISGGASAAEKSVTGLELWLKNRGFTQRLKDIGVTEALIPSMAADAVRLSGGGRSFLDAPVPLSAEKCEAVYRAAY
ncbi:MAG TPA: iron-containing alcohol dehydrogenase, partial [bacterium]|nr:iron-containing alcohol dehydrogenase [bacterium]